VGLWPGQLQAEADTPAGGSEVLGGRAVAMLAQRPLQKALDDHGTFGPTVRVADAGATSAGQSVPTASAA
jgi:hypothetical protein